MKAPSLRPLLAPLLSLGLFGVLAPLPVRAAAGPVAAAAGRGHLVLIGGGEKPADAMRKFIELAGGTDAPIVMIPTASTDDDAAVFYEKLFRETWGCRNAVSLDIRKRADAFRPDYALAAAKAKGIFFGGGDQVLITNALLGTPVGEAIAASFARGAVVGGTSAGTACQSRKMITGEGDFTVLRSRVVEVKEGLGLLPADVVVDQHFVVRKRLNRLLSVVLENPGLLGVGVDEGTAAWVRPDGTMQVLGKSCVVVVDPAGAEVTVRPSGTGEDALGVHGMRLHVLLPGERYDLASRKVLPPAK